MLKVSTPSTDVPIQDTSVTPADLAAFDLLLRRTTYLLNFLTRNSFASAGLTLSRFWVLLTVAMREWTTMSQLQEVLLISPGSLTTVVDGMVAEDLLIRERCREDRRQVLLQLSPAGRKLLDEVESYRTTVLAECLGPNEKTPDAPEHLTSAELDAASVVLGRLESGLVTILKDKSCKVREEAEK